MFICCTICASLLSIFSCPSSSLSSYPPLLSSLHPLSSSLSGITLVDETSPVDEPSDSDQVTEGVKFAYTLPHQQSNQEDSQDDTALVCVHPCACVSACVCTCMCVGLCVHMHVYFGVYIFKCMLQRIWCVLYVYIVYAHVVGTQ